MSDKYAWSTDEERYYGPFASIAEAFDDACSDECFIGECYQPHAEGYVNADFVLDRIRDKKGGDPAEWPEDLRKYRKLAWKGGA